MINLRSRRKKAAEARLTQVGAVLAQTSPRSWEHTLCPMLSTTWTRALAVGTAPGTGMQAFNCIESLAQE